MFNTTIVDRRTTKQEVTNISETNVESSGSISQETKNSRFININKSMSAFKTIFSSSPFYIEVEQIENGVIKDERYGSRNIFERPYYKEVKTKVLVEVKQVLVVGIDYTLEIIELSKENISEKYSSSENKNKYFNTPTII